MEMARWMACQDRRSRQQLEEQQLEEEPPFHYDLGLVDRGLGSRGHRHFHHKIHGYPLSILGLSFDPRDRYRADLCCRGHDQRLGDLGGHVCRAHRRLPPDLVVDQFLVDRGRVCRHPRRDRGAYLCRSRDRDPWHNRGRDPLSRGPLDGRFLGRARHLVDRDLHLVCLDLLFLDHDRFLVDRVRVHEYCHDPPLVDRAQVHVHHSADRGDHRRGPRQLLGTTSSQHTSASETAAPYLAASCLALGIPVWTISQATDRQPAHCHLFRVPLLLPLSKPIGIYPSFYGRTLDGCRCTFGRQTSGSSDKCR
mmetsp:Transcript_84159/g.132904  ORF Transcript_84159/g.132904 Transcript_84159/m.132904 type:complete len:308 (+) Transcript_84159:973-1896(+)